MSLINQMLQDLEKRQPVDAPVAPTDALPWAVPIKSSHSKQSVYRVLLLLLVLCGMIAGFKMFWPLLTNTTVQLKSAYALPTNKVLQNSLVQTGTTAFKPLQAQTLATLGVVPPAISQVSFEPSLEKTLSLSLASGLIQASDAVVQQSRALKPTPKPTSNPANTTRISDETPAKVTALANVTEAPLNEVPEVIAGEKANVAQKKATEKPMDKAVFNKVTSPAQQALNEYRQAVTLIQQGRVTEAQDKLKNALVLDSTNHEVRQVLVGLLVENKRRVEAMQLLQEGLALSADQATYALHLARLQLDAGQSAEALATLEKTLPHAKQYAAYHAFYAVLLQRTEQHALAVQYYQMALREGGEQTAWLVGLAVSLQAEGQLQEAIAYYRKAQTYGLTGDLNAFVALKLKHATQSVIAQNQPQ